MSCSLSVFSPSSVFDGLVVCQIVEYPSNIAVILFGVKRGLWALRRGSGRRSKRLSRLRGDKPVIIGQLV